MKILAVSSLFPPYHLGGYDIRCQEVLENLKARGHEVRILTSMYGFKKSFAETQFIWRQLHYGSAKTKYESVLWDIQDLRCINSHIKSFKPDVIHLFHTSQLTRALFPFLDNKGIPIVYDEGGRGLVIAWTRHGQWISFCEKQFKSNFRNWLKSLLCKSISIVSGGILPLNWSWPTRMTIYFNSYFTKEYHRKIGIPVDNSIVIHSGIDLSCFNFYEHPESCRDIHLLMPTRIHQEKGIEDAIDALDLLINKDKSHDFTLEVVGAIQDNEFNSKIINKIEQLNLGDFVKFSGRVPYEKMTNLYKNSDFCLLLTTIPESFSRVPLEAMASGTILITTATGGGAEIVENGKTGFIIPIKSPNIIAEEIIRLLADPTYCKSIRQNARKTIEMSFTIRNAVDQIEQVLFDAVGIPNNN